MRWRTPAPCALVDEGATHAVSAPTITTPASTPERVHRHPDICPIMQSLQEQQYRIGLRVMAGLIEAIDIKRKMFFEYENAPYHCLEVEVSKPTARGGQTLVRVKTRNLLTR